MRSAPEDRTAVARIRDAAIDQWGQHGFNVGLRSIAEAAGVSAALVIHHFGSKEEKVPDGVSARPGVCDRGQPQDDYAFAPRRRPRASGPVSPSAKEGGLLPRAS